MLCFYWFFIGVVGFSGCGFNSHRGFLFREVDRMDGACRTFASALAAGLAFGVVNVSEIVCHRDGFKWTNLCAFAAADAGSRTVFACNSAFFFVVAGNIYAAVVLAFVSCFEYATRTSLHAGLAANALVFFHFRKVGLRIDMDGIELAG